MLFNEIDLLQVNMTILDVPYASIDTFLFAW